MSGGLMLSATEAIITARTSLVRVMGIWYGYGLRVVKLFPNNHCSGGHG